MISKKWILFQLLFLPVISVQPHQRIANSIETDEVFTLAYDFQEAEICECDFCKEINAETYATRKKTSRLSQKNWTVIIYIAADNDLRSFAARNIKQMASIGSNHRLNILVHLDIRIAGNKKITRRYYIEQNKILHVNAHDPSTQQMDSGDPRTLISCCDWAIKNYPANEYALFFWNHGTGIIDPMHGRIINPAELFSFNPKTNRFDLDRTVGFLDLITNLEANQRGICWDDSTGNYLSNKKLQFALGEIKNKLLHGKKFAIIGFDACLMSMIEVAHLMKTYAHIMVSSQEVELGTGWNYTSVFKPFLHTNLNKEQLGAHIVEMFGRTYNSITNDYTLSALNLDILDKLEENLSFVAKILSECLAHQKSKSVSKAIKASKNKMLCTHFDEPSYIDLHHLYTNLLANSKLFALNDTQKEKQLISALRNMLSDGLKLINQVAFAKVCGRNLKKAGGISIYFPDRRIHGSYKNTTFATNNAWVSFLPQYLRS